MLEAIAAVPRAHFVPPDLQELAYANEALPIGCGQTISQPLVVARMCEALELGGEERVLDVGSGSGYHAAVLAHLAAFVWSVEIVPELAERARENLRAASISNVSVIVGDGAGGLPEHAPYGAINVAAAAAAVPPALEAQLALGGRLVAPVGGPRGQRLVLCARGPARIERRWLEHVRFVPLV